MEDHHCGDSLFPTSTLIPVTTICILLFVVGITGNTMTILIIQCFKDMKTTTNLYLSSMDISDLVIFLSLPFDLYRLWKYVPWVFGELVCRLSHYINERCTNATILHITVLSMERYLAICFPFKAKAAITKRRVKYVILTLWGIALLSAATVLFLMGVEYENETMPDSDTRQCKHTCYAIESGLLHTTIWVSTAYFFCPMFGCSFCMDPSVESCGRVIMSFMGPMWQPDRRSTGRPSRFWVSGSWEVLRLEYTTRL
uniref:Motilin receptor n=1 Tax=Sinocyclocheilus anshuiensis TaxID=1608454 RepID=A0A671KEC0_9TELE